MSSPPTTRADSLNSSAGPSSPSSTSRETPPWTQQGCDTPRGFKHVSTFDPNLTDYFEGPRDIRHFSRIPICLRIYGSVLPKMIVPLVCVTIWSTAITAVCEYIVDLGINSILLGVLGFIISLALSFRVTTAYERFSEGCKYWAALMFNARVLARTIWIFVGERHDVSEELGKSDLLGKLSAINLITAYALAMKHRLRFEPAVCYHDLAPYVAHLDTMAGRADQQALVPEPKSLWYHIAEYLGIPLFRRDPRDILDHADDNLGNMPLEILTYLSSFIKHAADQKLLDGCHHGNIMGCINSLTDIQGSLERVSNTPIPIAYSITISQITWVYVLLLPFQLWPFLRWSTIPWTIFAAYILLSFERIGREIEDPFGVDVNDLPLDEYCEALAADFEVLTRTPAPEAHEWMATRRNKVLWPLSMDGFDAWLGKSVEEIRKGLYEKANGKRGRRSGTSGPNERTPLLEEV